MRHLIVLAAIIVIPAYSQTAGVVMSGTSMSVPGWLNENTFTYNVSKDAAIYVVTGAPYSGSSQTVRTLANGTHLTQPGLQQPMTYRDSLGRTRTESRMQPAPLTGNAPPQIASLPEIGDPVAGYRIILDPVHQVAHRIAVQARQKRAPNVNTAMARVMPAFRAREGGVTALNEDLGTQTIFGISAVGQRVTTTYPVGTYQGNDQPVTMVNESWRSVQYDMILKSTNTGPDSNSTMTMKDFSTAEPDPSLFIIPAGYKTVDETSEFTIAIPRNAQ